MGLLKVAAGRIRRQIPRKVEGTAVLKAICAGFKETTEPRVCMTQDLCSYNLITVAVILTDRFISSVVVTALYDLVADTEMDECLHNWRDEKTNITACRVQHPSFLL
ncbi:hypothetical protein ZWY2020_037619 [Hordeum vulgare]|nr:hypothetical protein ZWY2020_037619 [Hordeum vulgare]